MSMPLLVLRMVKGSTTLNLKTAHRWDDSGILGQSPGYNGEVKL